MVQAVKEIPVDPDTATAIMYAVRVVNSDHTVAQSFTAQPFGLADPFTGIVVLVAFTIAMLALIVPLVLTIFSSLHQKENQS